MAFKLTKADENALSKVNITIDGDGTTAPLVLNSDNLMFPPVLTKDSKSAEWMEVPSGSYEPFKYYVQSKSRQIAIEFQWVTGGRYTPNNIHDITSKIKAYFYGAYFGSDGNNKARYPIVTITEFYGIIPKELSTNGKSSTWRMMDVDVKRSKEMIGIGTGVNKNWYSLHTTVSINLESASQLGAGGGDAPIFDFDNLAERPIVQWY